MPKIRITEYDRTKPGSASYANFSVVVPGFCGDQPVEGVFDENGIYECSSQADFKNYIKIKKEPNITSTDEAAIKAIFTQVSANTEAGEVDIDLDTEYYIKKDTSKNKGVGGYLDDGDSVYQKVTEIDIEAIESYYTCTEKGKDAIEAGTNLQIGNQIAYELLGLGYTVLFVKLTSPTNTDFVTKLDCLKDKASYDFRYIVTGYIGDSSANGAIIDLANTRQDCIALTDINASYVLNKTQATFIDDIKNALPTANKYSACFAPAVTYSDSSVSTDYDNRTFPASFHYLACAAKAQANSFAEWYAVAGYTRGVSPFSIVSTAVKLGDSAVDALQPRTSGTGVDLAVNLIVKIKDQYYLWGNRTAKTLENELVASDFLNIRQLCTTLKKEIYIACRKFTFDPNSDTLWINFKNSITPLLERMKSDQGISDYKIIKQRTDLKATLKAVVRIVPIEAVEDFEIGISLEDSLSGTSVEFEDSAN